MTEKITQADRNSHSYGVQPRALLNFLPVLIGTDPFCPALRLAARLTAL